MVLSHTDILWGWGNTLAPAGVTQHDSVYTVSWFLAPDDISCVFYSRNPEKGIWLASYKEEYYFVPSNKTFDVIAEKEYIHL